MRLQFLCALMIGAVATVRAQAPSKQAKQAPDPRSLILVGDRFKPLKYDEMTPEQKTMIDHLLAGERRGAGGPFNVLLRSRRWAIWASNSVAPCVSGQTSPRTSPRSSSS